jgi:hypothetical protein
MIMSKKLAIAPMIAWSTDAIPLTVRKTVSIDSLGRIMKVAQVVASLGPLKKENPRRDICAAEKRTNGHQAVTDGTKQRLPFWRLI